jgi:hypothetical protein
MANVQRWRRGERNEVKVSVDSATAIEIGDLLWLDTDDAKPFSDQADQGSEGANQQLIHDTFLGVAMEAHPADSGAYQIRVARTGVFEFPCIAATHEIGDKISSDEDSGGTTLQNQVVVKVATSNASIGTVAAETTSATTVLVDIQSSMFLGGVQNIL